MSTEAQSQVPAVIEPVLPPVAFSVTEAGLAELREKNKGLTKVTADNYDTFKANVNELVKLRTSLEAERNTQLKTAREHTENVNTEAARVKGLIVAIEEPIKNLKADYDTKAKAAKEKIERENRERCDRINAKVDLIEQRGRELDQYDAAELSRQLSDMREQQPTEDVFEEFHAVAMERWESTVARITVAHGQRVAYELEQQQLKEAQDKLAKDKADAAASQKVIDDANAAAAKKLDDDRAEFEAEQRKAKEKADSEADAEKRKAAEAEQEKRDVEIAQAAAQEALDEKQRQDEALAEAEAEAMLMAPDKEKLERYADELQVFIDSAPALSNDKASKVLGRCERSLEQTKATLLDAAERL